MALGNEECSLLLVILNKIVNAHQNDISGQTSSHFNMIFRELHDEVGHVAKCASNCNYNNLDVHQEGGLRKVATLQKLLMF